MMPRPRGPRAGTYTETSCILPVRANIWHTWGRLELAFPLDLGDPAGEAVAFRLVGLSAPEPMLLSTSRRTSPPPRQIRECVRRRAWAGGRMPCQLGEGQQQGKTAAQHA